MKKTICLILTLILLATSLSACGKDEAGEPLFAERGDAAREPLGELRPADGAEAVLEALSAAGQTHGGDLDDDDPEGPGTGIVLERSVIPAGDPVVTDGSYIYMSDRYGLIILSAAGERSEILSYTRVEREGTAWAERLFLDRDRVAVVYTAENESLEEAVWNDEAAVHVVLLDVSDKRAPKKLTETVVEGSWVDARMIAGKLCLVTQRSYLSLPGKQEAERLLPRLWEDGKELSLRADEVYLSPAPEKAAVSLAAAIRLTDGRVADAMAFTGGVEAVCGEGDCIYLSRTLWDETASEPYREEPYTVMDYGSTARTEIRRLRLAGGLRLDGGCVVDGALRDAAAMELQNGSLRLVLKTDSRRFSAYTDEKHGWTNYETHSHERDSRLVLLDEALQSVAALTAIGGKSGVSASVFAGGAAWFSAAGRVLYTADLSDPAEPRMNGSLPTEGERTLLRSFGAELALGVEAPAPGAPWQLVMYDLSDPANPKAADRLTLKDWSPASDLSDAGALFTDPANCLIGFPAVGKGRTEYLLVRWTGSELKQKGALALEYVPADARALLLDGLLYVCSPGAVYVADPETMSVLATVSNAVG